MTEQPTDIVGHKSFDTGEIGPEGFPVMRHEPVTRAEADAIFEEIEKAKGARAVAMPDDKAAIKMMFAAWQRLKELGWRDAQYGPTDGRQLDVIEIGSTGIHSATRDSERRYWVADAHDMWPSDPVLYREAPPPPSPRGDGE